MYTERDPLKEGGKNKINWPTILLALFLLRSNRHTGKG